MKKRKKHLSLILALLLCLSLTACGGEPNDAADDDWRENGSVRATGDITRSGVGDITVLAVLFEDRANFYFDDSTPVICEQVLYPVELRFDPDEAFQSIDFADRNGDGNSDVALLLEADGEQVLMVWFWDAESETYVFQPEESQIDSLINDEPVPEGLEGVWYPDGDEEAESVIAFDADDNWTLYDNTDGAMEEIDRGFTRAADEESGIYVAESEVFDGASYYITRSSEDENELYWSGDGSSGYYERLDW